jgi:transposase InsO family protein
MDLDESSDRITFPIRDRAILHPPEPEHILSDAGIRTVRSAVRAPRMNSIMERWIGGCRRELLDHTLIWNLPHLRRILRDYEAHHNTHRPHIAGLVRHQTSLYPRKSSISMPSELEGRTEPTV